MGSTITFTLIQRALGNRKKVNLIYLSSQHIVLHPVQRQEAFSIVSFPLVHPERKVAHFLSSSLFDPVLVWKIRVGGQRVNAVYSSMKDFIYNHLAK